MRKPSLEDIIKSYAEISTNIEKDFKNRFKDMDDDIEDIEKEYEKKYYSRTQPPALLNIFGDIANAIPKLVYKFLDKFRNLFSAGGGGGGDGDSNEPANNENENKPRGNIMNWKAITAIALLILTVALTPMLAGINDGGHRTVVQYLGGQIETKFDTGLFAQNLGKTVIYNDVLTFDFDKNANAEGSASIDQAGIPVQYQDGGLGTIYGIFRVKLPGVNEDMLKVHKDFRSNEGIAYKLVKTYVEGILNDTAGLMTSEQSYAEMRSTLTQWANDQLRHGKYITEQKEIITVEAGNEYCLEDKLTPEDTKLCKDVRKTRKMIPVIAYGDDGKPLRAESDLAEYGLIVSGFEITDRGYETKTMKQISDKREATMAIITSKANAERAKQDAITAEQTGLAAVVTEQYVQEVEKKKQVVIAERQKQVAEIKAQKQVEVARQSKLEAEQLKLAAVEYEQEQKLRGQGDGAYKKAVMESDGYAIQKIQAWKEVQIVAYSEMAKQKWASESVVVMGGGSDMAGTSGASNLEQFMGIIAAKSAKDLNLDMSIKTQTTK